MNRKMSFLATLVLLAVIGGISLIPATATPKLSLQAQLFTQSVTLTPWQNTITFGTSTSPLCPSSPSPSLPFTFIVGGVNFTENLSGRDPGSTLVQFRGLPQSQHSYLLKAPDASTQFVSEFVCIIFSNNSTNRLNLLNIVQASLPSSSGLWRVLSSGNYVLLMATLQQLGSGILPSNWVVANETWTTTTIG